MSMTEIPTIENASIPQINSFEGTKIEANQPLVETENLTNASTKIEDNTAVIGRDDAPKAEIKIVGTDIPVSVGFMSFQDLNDDRISIVNKKIAGTPIEA